MNGFGAFGGMFGPGVRAEADPGYGPTPGKPSSPARGGGIPFDDIARANRAAQPFDDAQLNPNLQGTVDVLKGVNRGTITVPLRDIPLVTIQNTWSVEQARGSIFAHMIGIFYQSGMLAESILGDDRVTACLAAKATSLFGREVRFKAANDSVEAKKVLQAWEDWWPILAGDSSMRLLEDYATVMGFSHAQQVWNTSVPGLPFGGATLRPWFPQFEYYDWDLRRYMAMGTDGNFPIVPGNGRWVEHAPWGSYRGWIRGAIRPVTEPWMLRHFGFRDMARFGEVHGNPTRVGYIPMMGDPQMREEYQQALSRLGADSALMLPRGVNSNDQSGYGYELVEAKSSAWEVHPAQIDRCDMAITLAILMQNLTTEVDGGSYGAAKVHQAKEAGGTRFGNQAWKNTIRNQLARPFAYLNFGDANLAPWTWYDVTGSEEYEANADQWNKAATGMNQFAQSGVRFADGEEVRVWLDETMGLKKFPKFTMTDPVVAGGAAGEKPMVPPKGAGNARPGKKAT